MVKMKRFFSRFSYKMTRDWHICILHVGKQLTLCANTQLTIDEWAEIFLWCCFGLDSVSMQSTHLIFERFFYHSVLGN